MHNLAVVVPQCSLATGASQAINVVTTYTMTFTPSSSTTSASLSKLI
jgi:hypothetical protein